MWNRQEKELYMSITWKSRQQRVTCDSDFINQIPYACNKVLNVNRLPEIWESHVHSQLLQKKQVPLTKTMVLPPLCASRLMNQRVEEHQVMHCCPLLLELVFQQFDPTLNKKSCIMINIIVFLNFKEEKVHYDDVAMLNR